MTKEEREAFLKNSHELYHQRGRIVRRLDRASSQGLKRFADALEVLSDDELDIIANECERMALEKLKTTVFERQPDHEQESNEEI